MGGIVIDIWEKSNFFRTFGSQKGAKNAMVGLTGEFIDEFMGTMNPLVNSRVQ